MGNGFETRAYYTIVGRQQRWGEAEWRRYLDAAAEDGCNLVTLWIAGAFASRRFPTTWDYNRDHPNVRSDFLGRVIDHAHNLGIKIALGFGTFCYDGVNRIPLAHPELAGRTETGEPVRMIGLHSIGQLMCASQPAAHDAMAEYVREMYLDFYPQADGLFMESADYGHCVCSDCRDDYFAKEHDLVMRLSEIAWAHRPDALSIIYPHYLLRAGRPVDPRQTLFFTVHSAPLDDAAIAAARSSMYWTLALETSCDGVAEACRLAAADGVGGFSLGMEPLEYERDAVEIAEDGFDEQLVPYDARWLSVGQFPFEDLVVKVVRIAFRVYTAAPEATEDDLCRAIARTMLGSDQRSAEARDLLALHRLLSMDIRSFKRRGPIAYPTDFPPPWWTPEQIAEAKARYRQALARLEAIAQRHRGSDLPALAEAARIADWILARWADERHRLEGA